MKVSSQRFTKSLVQFAALALVLMGCIPLASAQGYDLFQTGSGANIDLTSLRLGIVPLQGVPIWTKTLGTTDTITHRTAPIPSGGGTVPMVMTALSMKSTHSVSFQGQAADVYVTINNSGGAIPLTVLPQPDQLSPSSGSLTARTDGTFDSVMTVTADVIFVRAGTSSTDPKNYIGHQAAPVVRITSTGSKWTATPPSNYPVNSLFPSNGFVATVVNHNTSIHPLIIAQILPGGAL